MSAIDFPNTPTVNQLFSVGNRTWQWTGQAWNTIEEIVVGPTGPAGPIYPLTVSLLPPTGGNDGDVWMVYS